jgi:heparan-alpha-glucosaminide N-acetyltransferase
MPEPELSAATLPQRNIAVDAYRGFVMILMMAEVLEFHHIARSFPGNPFWQILGFNQSHVEWAGMSLHDTIQPSFTFLVGVALPYSLRSRQRRGQTFRRKLGHTIVRSLILVALGVALRLAATHIVTFEDTLTQIGLGYTFAFLLAFVRPRWLWTALAAILFAYWLLWALYPLPPPGFDYASIGLTADWQQAHLLHGFAAHWNKNVNAGVVFDRWFVNLFPRRTPFLYNDGGYLTLSFIPTLGTMILGLIAGRWFLASAPRIPIRRFLLAGLGLCAAGLLLHFTGICPIVKRIWTPSWTLFSGGICFFFLAAFSWLIDVRQHVRWTFPLLVVGMNSIAAYVLSEIWEGYIDSGLRYVAHPIPHIGGATFEPFIIGGFTLAVEALILYWMYRRRIFLRI